MVAVRLRNIAGKFFFENQNTTPATMAKFSTTASQYAPSMLNPVIFERSFTEAECLKGVVSSSPAVSLDWPEVESLEVEAVVFWSDEFADCDSGACANANIGSSMAAASSNPSFPSFGSLNLAKLVIFCLSATRLRQRRLENDADDFRRQTAGFGFQRSLRGQLSLFDGRSVVLHLCLRLSPGFGERGLADLHSQSPACFLGFQNRDSRVPQLLFILGRPLLGQGNVCAGLLDCALGAGVPLGQNSHQRLMDKYCVQPIQQKKKNNGWDGTKQ